MNNKEPAPKSVLKSFLSILLMFLTTTPQIELLNRALKNRNKERLNLFDYCQSLDLKPSSIGSFMYSGGLNRDTGVLKCTFVVSDWNLSSSQKESQENVPRGTIPAIKEAVS